MAIIFHITSGADWRAAQDQGRYEAESLRTEGFIHCSDSAQVVPVANLLFRGRDDLVLLRIHADRVAAPLRYDTNEFGTFPHIYGPLNLDAVADVLPFPCADDGGFALPADAI